MGNETARHLLNYGRFLIMKRYNLSTEINHVKRPPDTSFEDFDLLTHLLSMFPVKGGRIRKTCMPSLLKVVINTLSSKGNSKVVDKVILFCSKAILAIGMKQDYSARQYQHSQTTSNESKQSIFSLASFFVTWLDDNSQKAPSQLVHDYSDVTNKQEYSTEVQTSNIYNIPEGNNLDHQKHVHFLVTCVLSEIGDEEVLHLAFKVTSKCSKARDIRISLAGACAFSDVSAKLRSSGNTFGDCSDDDEKNCRWTRHLLLTPYCDYH